MRRPLLKLSEFSFHYLEEFHDALSYSLCTSYNRFLDFVKEDKQKTLAALLNVQDCLSKCGHIKIIKGQFSPRKAQYCSVCSLTIEILIHITNSPAFKQKCPLFLTLKLTL